MILSMILRYCSPTVVPSSERLRLLGAKRDRANIWKVAVIMSQSDR